jgi:hypothetical protein
VHGDEIGGNNMEDPRQRSASFFVRLLAGGVRIYVVVAKCRRQGGSVSFSFTPGLYALCGMIGLDNPLFSSPEKRGKKQRLREGFHL